MWRQPDTLPEKGENDRFHVYLAFDNGEVALADWYCIVQRASEYHATTGVYVGQSVQDIDDGYMLADGRNVRIRYDGKWSWEIDSDTPGPGQKGIVVGWMEALRPTPEWGRPPASMRQGSTTDDYRNACSGKGEFGSLAYEWSDKPHRLVYDLCGEVDALRAVIGADLVDALRERDARIAHLEGRLRELARWQDRPWTDMADSDEDKLRDTQHALQMARHFAADALKPERAP